MMVPSTHAKAMSGQRTDDHRSTVRFAAKNHRPQALRGRKRERAVLDQLLQNIRDQKGSRVLVLRGEPGIGKTVLLDYLLDRTDGLQVTRAVGVRSETELAFAGLQHLCGPLLDGLEFLPAPQRDAIRVAFGLTAGPAPDAFLVSLGAFGLITEASTHRPVLCVVDDAQWLDRTSAQVLTFVACRLQAESVALIIAARNPTEREDFVGLPELVVKGLDTDAARELLQSFMAGRLDEQVVDRIIAETCGNPSQLLELGYGQYLHELAGGFAVPAAPALTPRIELGFLKRLPTETQRLLLVAAADPVGDATLLWRAADQLGLDVGAAAPAEAAGLLKLGTRVRFRHPHVRWAVYSAASLTDRQAAHRALAAATDPQLDPDRRAWHRAQATLGPDEDVAAELERSADRALARGGLAARAAFLERSAALTPEPRTRTQRALAAAEGHHQAGAPHAATALLAIVQTLPLEERERGVLDWLQGQIALQTHGGAEAWRKLLSAALQLESVDVQLAHETYLDAINAATFVEAPGNRAVEEVAWAIRAAPQLPRPQPAFDRLLEGLAVRFTDGYAAAAPILRRALGDLRENAVQNTRSLSWLSLALRTAADLFDDESWHLLATRHAQMARDAGALSVLPTALAHVAQLQIFVGAFDAAATLVDEADAIAEVTDSACIAGSLKFLLAAYQDEVGALSLIETGLRAAAASFGSAPRAFLDYANAILHNGLGCYDVAMRSAQSASAHKSLRESTWAHAELVEAAIRTGHVEVAYDAQRRLAAYTSASGTEWALGILARSRALLAEGRSADDLYREAVERLGRSRVTIELARARLVYGEWLRRERRRIEARDQLKTAYELFSAMGAGPFAQRARRELLATGERTRKRAVDTFDSLTAQEQQVARMARSGRSNQEIGNQLFISIKTVEYHLHKTFAKLGISSRHELGQVLAAE